LSYRRIISDVAKEYTDCNPSSQQKTHALAPAAAGRQFSVSR
jgi:hypothetical protein